MSVSGPTLAAQALKLGLVDECHQFLSPIVVGGGTQAFPDKVRLEFELLDERRFGNGVVHLHYRVKGAHEAKVAPVGNLILTSQSGPKSPHRSEI